MRIIASNNPSGIVINDGYYALLGAIVFDFEVEEALHKICGTKYGGDNRKKNRRNGQGKTERILQIYNENPAIKNSKIAEIVGCTREMVRIVLRNAGVPKRNKWENHKSLDMRYWRKK